MNIELKSNKEIILNSINTCTNKNIKLLSYFGLNEENFSKSLRIDLDKFSKEIKSNKDLFSTIEGEKLFFADFNSNFNQEKNLKTLDTLMRNIRQLNLKLKIRKEKLNNTDIIENNSKEKDNNFNSNFDFVSSKIEEIFCDLDKNPKNYGHVIDNSIDDKLKQINILKTEIVDLYKSNKILKEEKNEIEKKIQKFVNLPSDVDKIKEMIKLKREEYEIIISKK